MDRIDAKDRRIAELELLLRQALHRIDELEAEIARLKRNSTNSSKPPSSDPPSVEKPRASERKSSSGKKRGGQPGHSAHRRQMLVADKIIPLKPDACEQCGHALHGEDRHPRRMQIIDLPVVKPDVTDFICHRLACRQCGHKTRALPPPQARGGTFAPRLCAVISMCTGQYMLSKRDVRSLFSDIFGVTISLGSISAIERSMAEALDAPAAAATAYVQKQAVVHMDETGWRENKTRAWLWLASTHTVAVFHLARRRNRLVAQTMIGPHFAGTVVCDRFGAYHWLDAMQRQFCWSHLLRDFQSWVDRGVTLGKRFLFYAQRMFRWWHRVRDGTLQRNVFKGRMRVIQLAIASLLTEASKHPDKHVRATAKQLIKHEAALWRFVDVEGVEPTNNFAERLLRRAVLWRKCSFGTDSVAGSRFAERMLTSVATLKLQGRHVLDFLVRAFYAQLAQLTPPSLLPHSA